MQHQKKLLWGLLLLLISTSQSALGQRQKEKTLIQETVLRALFAAYGKSVPHEVYYVQLAGNDPTPVILQRFKNHTPKVLAGSRAGKMSSERKGFADSVTGKKGTLFGVEKITWQNATRARVEWRWLYWSRGGMGATYQVEKRKGHWSVKEIVPKSVWKN